MAIQNAREGVTGDIEYPGRLGHVQAERDQAVLPDAAAGMRGILHGHGVSFRSPFRG